jgi:hypothetical protein
MDMGILSCGRQGDDQMGLRGPQAEREENSDRMETERSASWSAGPTDGNGKKKGGAWRFAH